MRRKLVVILMVLGILCIAVPVGFQQYKRWQAQDIIARSEKKARKDEHKNSENQVKATKASQNKDKHNSQNSNSDRKKDNGNENSAAQNIDPFVTQGVRRGIDDAFSRSITEVSGYLQIKKINVKLPFYLSASTRNLANGAGLIAGTDVPGEGKGHHSVVAGHRGYYGATMFLRVNQLTSGDQIFLRFRNHNYYYRVIEKKIIAPNNSTALQPIRDKELLTLFTCHPYPTNYQRLLIIAERI